MEKVRYAMIGFGGIAENRIEKEGFACDKARFKPLKNAVLIGATDLNPARRSAVEALGLKWYSSIDEILADPEIQAVYVATNNLTHAQLATKALNAGKHTIVEKPMSVTVEDGLALVALAKAKNLSLSVDHMMVNNAFNIEAQKMVASGKLGTVNDGCFHMEFAYGYDPKEAATWRCSNRAEMGGPVGDVASHCLYAAEFILGSKVTKLAAVYYPKLMSIRAEDGAYIKCTLANGISFSVKVAFSELRGGLGGTLSNLGYEIYGDKAALRGFGTLFQLSGHKDEPVPVRLELDTFRKTVKEIVPKKIVNIYQSLVMKHADSILTGKFLTGGDAVHNITMCNAIHESAQNGGKIVEIKG